MIVLCSANANSNVRAVLDALIRHDLLDQFVTTLGVTSDAPWLSVLPVALRRQARRRAFEVPKARFAPRPHRHLLHMGARRVPALQPLCERRGSGYLSMDGVGADLDAFAARTLNAVARRKGRSGALSALGAYCYEDCAVQTFRAAQKLGVPRFYELPIAYWETATQIGAEEAERYPAWARTVTNLRDGAETNDRKTEEVSLADVVITPSAFVLRSLPSSVRESRPCYIAPFGSPAFAFPSDAGATIRDNGGDKDLRPLRVLFAGSLSQRKGLADVFAAFRLLNRRDIELVVFGSLLAPLEFYRSEYADFTYEAPRPHSEVLKLMQACDVLVLPSLLEGRALVQQEALACGLPLIVTPNAGGEDLVDEGETGFLVPIRAPQVIAEKIAYFADHRDELPRFRHNARQKAALYTWESYGAIIMDAIQSYFQDPRRSTPFPEGFVH